MGIRFIIVYLQLSSQELVDYRKARLKVTLKFRFQRSFLKIRNSSKETLSVQETNVTLWAELHLEPEDGRVPRWYMPLIVLCVSAYM